MPRPSGGGWIAGQVDVNILLSFVFGVAFLSIILGFAVGFPNPTPLQVRVFITALALAAAGVGAILPGYFDIHYKSFVRAGGAMGMFALVYLSQPVLEHGTIQFVEPPSPPEPVASKFLATVDSGSSQGIWDLLDPVARGFVIASPVQIQQVYNNVRKPLGEAVKRELTGTSSVTSPQGFPIGLYRNLVFRTKFANVASCRPESVTLRATQDLKWHVFSHLIGQSSIDC